MNRKTIGRKVRELRVKMGLTIVALGRKVGLSAAQISRLETGCQGFRDATLRKFAKILRVPLVYFYVESEDVSTGKVAEELESYGLAPSRRLRKDLANPVFLKFAEEAAKFFSENKKSLTKMREALSGIERGQRRRRPGRPRRRRGQRR